MLQIKVSEATPRQLDWMVAYIMGHRVAENYGSYIRIYLPDPKQSGYTLAFCPSTDWALGGPIIERERLWVGYSAVGQSLKLLVMADDVVQCHKRALPPNCSTTGPTILIAAMRCYVSSKLGDEVEIPEELK